MTAPLALPPDTLAAFGGDELRARVYWEKYSLRGPDGEPTERTPQQMWDRVAANVAAVEPDPEQRAYWQREFRWLLGDFRFLPGGRVLHAIGQAEMGRKAVPVNCFVVPIKGDTIEDIYECAKEMAKTYSRGGGVGVDISVLRPAHSIVHNAAHESTGAVSFMETFSLVTGTIGMSGRRGALMITIRDDHPDVLDFVRIKRNKDKVRFANISVLVSDAFMRAVEQHGTWRLHFENPDAGVLVERTIDARELWDELIQGARDWAEPGCLFIDTARRLGTTEYNGMHVITSNPCGEQLLDPYNNCNLGSLSLLTFVRHPFAEIHPHDNVDWEGLRRAVYCAVRFLDNIVTYSDPLFPLDAQREAARRSRRIGLGITGLGDLLAAVRLRYDTDEAIAFTNHLMEFIKIAAYEASADLAEEKGAFPAFDVEQHLTQEFFRDFPEALLDRIRAVGLRNVALMTVPPTGSISAMAGVTSGIEPIFALTYVRRSESLSQEQFTVVHPLAEAYFRAVGQRLPDLRTIEHPDRALREALPDFFVTSHEIDPLQRVRMQAAIAKHVDNSVSTTVNLPREASTETVAQVYRLAWELGCKGITVYREGSRDGILITQEEAKRGHHLTTLADKVRTIATDAVPDLVLNGGSADQQIEEAVRALAERLKQGPVQLTLGSTDIPIIHARRKILPGFTHQVRTAMGSMFVTISEENDRPIEIFCRLGKGGSHAEADSEMAGRLISLLLRVDRLPSGDERLELIREQLAGIGGGDSYGFGPNKVRSIADAIAKAIGDHLESKQEQAGTSETTRALTPALTATNQATVTIMSTEPAVMPIAGGSNGNLCPQCHEFSLIEDRGCTRCARCSYREC